jgi:hypothetical protein
MHSSLRVRSGFACVALSLALAAGCGGRWKPAEKYEVRTLSDPRASYAAVMEVVKADGYSVARQDDANQRVRVEARVSGKEADRKSFINLEVSAGAVRLTGDGYLVHGDGKIHKTLSNELASLEDQIKARLAGGAAPATPSAPPAAPVDAAGVPTAWSEPAYDPSVWGNGNFTCLPVRVPAEHQSALTLQLSTGEKADLALSLAYAPELCRSPAQCKVNGGCPALGIGDPDRVSKLAARLSKGEVASQAILLDSGKPVATIDLAHHGSIVQAMSEIKK